MTPRLFAVAAVALAASCGAPMLEGEPSVQNDALRDANDDPDDGDDNGNGGGGNGRVTLCHATGSATNPWVEITVSENAVDAHRRHQDGGDIIPAPAGGCPGEPGEGEGEAGGEGEGEGEGEPGEGEGEGEPAQCVVRADCDDGLFCNGPPVCFEGICGQMGYPCGTYGCNEVEDRCNECTIDIDCGTSPLIGCSDGVCRPVQPGEGEPTGGEGEGEPTGEGEGEPTGEGEGEVCE